MPVITIARIWGQQNTSALVDKSNKERKLGWERERQRDTAEKGVERLREGQIHKRERHTP